MIGLHLHGTIRQSRSGGKMAKFALEEGLSQTSRYVVMKTCSGRLSMEGRTVERRVVKVYGSSGETD